MKRFYKGKNSKKVYWVQIPVKMVSVAWILSTTEWCQDNVASCSEEITETKATTPKNVLVRMLLYLRS
jgi:hypothetical protein